MKLFIELEIENDEVKSAKVVKPKVEGTKSIDAVSQYARYFNDGCPGWTKDSEHNLYYLKQQEIYANERLRARGYLFLNDVYDMLGIPRTKAGQVVGWIYSEKNPMGDNEVRFDLFADRNQDFVNGLSKSVLLDFNVDGPILDQLKD